MLPPVCRSCRMIPTMVLPAQYHAIDLSHPIFLATLTSSQRTGYALSGILGGVALMAFGVWFGKSASDDLAVGCGFATAFVGLGIIIAGFGAAFGLIR